MGYTKNTIELIKPILDIADVKSVLDYGAQNNYAQPKLPAPYISEWYREQGISDYTCIDLNGENGAIVQDLTKPFSLGRQFGLVTDIGTSEHTLDLYMCMKNLFEHCKIKGFIHRENPKTGSWPGHGFSYMTLDFYNGLVEMCDISILQLGEFPAMNNIKDGWIVYCSMLKIGPVFPNREDFAKLPCYPK